MDERFAKIIASQDKLERFAKRVKNIAAALILCAAIIYIIWNQLTDEQKEYIRRMLRILCFWR
jgi:23S rRNA maturation mini-RNase III